MGTRVISGPYDSFTSYQILEGLWREGDRESGDRDVLVGGGWRRRIRLKFPRIRR